MKRIKIKLLVIAFPLLFCLMLSSCAIAENVLQVSSEVDFSTPQKVQISYNEHIYDTVIVFKNAKVEVNFITEKDLMSGAYVSLNPESYKITYKDMVFEGSISNLSDSFLPCVVYSFLSSFEGDIVLDSYDKEKNCHYTKRNINNYFVVLESYEKDGITNYSMEIK